MDLLEDGFLAAVRVVRAVQLMAEKLSLTVVTVLLGVASSLEVARVELMRFIVLHMELYSAILKTARNHHLLLGVLIIMIALAVRNQEA